jgi:hypothetical protein
MVRKELILRSYVTKIHKHGSITHKKHNLYYGLLNLLQKIKAFCGL